jgi:hypothetical protein
VYGVVLRLVKDNSKTDNARRLTWLSLSRNKIKVIFYLIGVRLLSVLRVSKAKKFFVSSVLRVLRVPAATEILYQTPEDLTSICGHVLRSHRKILKQNEKQGEK